MQRESGYPFLFMLMEKRFAHYPISSWILITFFLAVQISPDSYQELLIQEIKVKECHKIYESKCSVTKSGKLPVLSVAKML